jgi:hypothetical protein
VQSTQVVQAAKLGDDVAVGTGLGHDFLERAFGCVGVARSFLEASQRRRCVGRNVGQAELVGQVERLAGPANRVVVALPVGVRVGMNAEQPGT